VCTFDPHPNAVVRPGYAPKSISNLAHRKELLTQCGVDHVEVVSFTPELANLAPLEFSRDFLRDRLGAQIVWVGENFTYGRNGSGDAGTLTENGIELGFSVQIFDLVQSDGTISSTRIRELVGSGKVHLAAEMLGRNFILSGTVVRGDQRGRELGYPTANLDWDDQLLVPADGVYAGYVIVSGDRLPAAISVGTNPQFQGRSQRVEAHVLDRTDLELYGARVGVEFAEFIRSQEVFGSLDDYLLQIGVDVATVSELLPPEPA
jgi:riboflavin kinase/FMN adenylyltransferase